MDLRPYLAVKAIEILQQKCLGQLPGPVSAKIEKQNHVAITHALLICVRKNQWRHELVCFSVLVLLIHSRRRRRFADLTATENNRVPRLFRTVPTSVAVHRKISAYNRDTLPD